MNYSKADCPEVGYYSKSEMSQSLQEKIIQFTKNRVHHPLKVERFEEISKKKGK